MCKTVCLGKIYFSPIKGFSVTTKQESFWKCWRGGGEWLLKLRGGVRFGGKLRLELFP